MRVIRSLFGTAVVAACAVFVLALASSAGARTEQSPPSTLVVVSPVGVPSLDREAFGTSTQQEVLTNTNEPLLRFKPESKRNKDGVLVTSARDLVGGVCVKHRVSADGKTIRCTLGNFRSPYGNQITSADVKWTFDNAIAAKNIGLLVMSLISADFAKPVTIVNRKVFDINLTERNSISERALNFFFLSPIDSKEALKHATAKDPFAREWIATHSAGFGPYHVTSFVPNKDVRLERNPNYRGNPSAGVPAATIKNIVYRTVPDNGTRAQLLRSGAAHISKSIDLGMYQALRNSKTTRTYKFPYNAEHILYFNTTKAPFTDVRVRRAIACAIDKNEIAAKTYFGQSAPAHSIVTPKVGGWTPEFDECPKQDIPRAQSLLAAAGKSDLEVTLVYSKGNSGQDAEDNATLIRGQLAKAGIKATIQQEPDASKFFLGAIVGQYSLFLFTIGSNVPDAGWTFGTWFTGVLNFNKYESPQLAEAVATIKRLPVGAAERRAAIRDFQRIQMAQQTTAPIIEILNEYIVYRSVCGLRSDPGDFFYWQFLRFCG